MSQSKPLMKQSNKRTKPNGAAPVPGHLRRLNWLLTINTNQQVDDNLDYNDIIEHFKNLCTKLFSRQMLTQTLCTTPADDWQKIKDVDIDLAIEWHSSEKRLLHCHTMFCVAHYTKVQLNYDFIKRYINQGMAEFYEKSRKLVVNCYFHNRLAPTLQTVEDMKQRIKSYIHKEQQG